MAVCRNSIRNGLKHHREKSHERAGLSTATNISWQGVHPFSPVSEMQGCLEMLRVKTQGLSYLLSIKDGWFRKSTREGFSKRFLPKLFQKFPIKGLDKVFKILYKVLTKPLCSEVGNTGEEIISSPQPWVQISSQKHRNFAHVTAWAARWEGKTTRKSDRP